MLRVEMLLVPVVTSVVKGFDVLVKYFAQRQFVALFAASRHCFQLKLSLVTYIVSIYESYNSKSAVHNERTNTSSFSSRHVGLLGMLGTGDMGYLQD